MHSNEDESSEMPSPTDEFTLPTQTPAPVVPIVNDSFTSNSTIIEFVDKGFNNGSFISTENSQSDIFLIKSTSDNVILQTKDVEHPDSSLFVSPTVSNTVFTISSPPEGREDYGRGIFGVHANYKNPVIQLPLWTVPLNIFNDDESFTKLEFTRNHRNSLKLLETNQISLKKLTISKGTLHLNVPNETSEVCFDEVETFLNGNLLVENGNTDVISSIDSLVMNAGSNLHVSEVEFNGSIIANDNSQVTIEKKAKFSEHSTLELSESSLIEFGNAAIEGICKEIKLLRNNDSLPALTKLEEQNSLSPS